MNVTDSDGDAAVCLAVLYGHDKCLDLLIDAGVAVNSVKTTETLNHHEMQEIEETKNGRGFIPHTVPAGSPILHVAVYESFDKCVRVLIEAGADVNVVPDSGEPAVITAVRKGYSKCVAALVAAGADVNTKPKSIFNRSAIDFAIDRSDPEILKLILTSNVAENSLNAALNRASSSHDSMRSQKSLLESELAAYRTNSSSPASENIPLEEKLQKATENIRKSLECLELLMNYSTNKTDILTVAAQNGLHAFVKSLVEGGIDVNGSDSRGKNALIAAVSENNIDCVKLLINTGADLNVSDQHGTTPLMKAAANGHLNITEILIRAGAKVNATDSRGSTPLMHVWFNGNSECIDLLLRSGADVNIVDNVGDTALTRAASKGFVTCMKILIKAGADVNVNSSRALHLTALHGHVECLQFLLKAGA